jgi:hypothetical protein
LSEVLTLINKNKFERKEYDGQMVNPFCNFSQAPSSSLHKIKNLFWINEVDGSTPYDTGYENKLWVVSKLLFNIAVRGRERCHQREREAI